MVKIKDINPVSFTSGPGMRVEITIDSDNGVELSEIDLVNQIRKFRPYIGLDDGGVTFKGKIISNISYINEVCHLCHKAGFSTCVEISETINAIDINLDYIDLFIIDIQSIPMYNYRNLTIEQLMNVDDLINKLIEVNKDFWFKQVIMNNVNNNFDYMKLLKKYINKYSEYSNFLVVADDITNEQLEELKTVI